MNNLEFSWNAFNEQQSKLRQWRYEKFGGRQKETISIKNIKVGAEDEKINIQEKTSQTCNRNTTNK